MKLPTFDEVYRVTDRINGEMAFDEDASRLLYSELVSLPNWSNILEVGCKYGRSTSIMAQVGVAKRFNLHLIDNYREDDSAEAALALVGMLFQVGSDFTLHRRDSKLVTIPNLLFDLVHIDGGHGFEEVLGDAQKWSPYVSRHGRVCFHDYQRTMLPSVTEAVRSWASGGQFTMLACKGTLAVFGRAL